MRQMNEDIKDIIDTLDYKVHIGVLDSETCESMKKILRERYPKKK